MADGAKTSAQVATGREATTGTRGKSKFAFYSNCGEIDRKPTVAAAGRTNGKEGQREAQGSAFP